MKDKAYRATPVGGEVGRFLRALRWADRPQNTLDTYEIVLARLAYDHAHYQALDEFTTEALRDFLDEHWGEAAPATRRNRLAIVKSFFRWAVEERGLGENPAERIKPPEEGRVDRQAYAPDVIEKLRRAQPTLRDQICVQLLGRLALRKNELRLLRVGDFDLGAGHVRRARQGRQGRRHADRVRRPQARPRGCTWSAATRTSTCCTREADATRPMDPASVHRWFKRCLERAGLPATIKTARAPALGGRQPVARDREPAARAAAAAARVRRDDAGVPAPDP